MTHINGIPVSDSTLRNENLHLYGEASESLHVAAARRPKYHRIPQDAEIDEKFDAEIRRILESEK